MAEAGDQGHLTRLRNRLVSVRCPACGYSTFLNKETYVVASFGGTMKERLRSGEYFTFHCPRCQERSFYAHPMLYHDPQKRFMLILNEEESHLDHEKDVICVQVHTGEAFIEHLRFLDDGLRPEQIMWVKTRLQRRYPQAEIIYDSLENDCLWFLIKEGGQAMPAGVPLYSIPH